MVLRVSALRMCALSMAAVCALGLRLLAADSIVVFNEIMYHPAADEAAYEWLELHNQMAVEVDLSGWRVAGGVQYTFPEGTIVASKGYLVLAAAPDALAQATGLTGIRGPFAGRLENAGELLELRNNSDRLMDLVNYEDTGRWPIAADGSGASLAKLDPNTASGPVAAWAASRTVGGTPGAVNFPSADDPGAARVVFNETLVTPAARWIELVNAGGAAFDLTGATIVRRDVAAATYVFGAQSLAAGAFLTLSAAELGFDLAAGDTLFLFGADGAAVLAAVRLADGGRARLPDGTGSWYAPDEATPGAANRVSLRSDVVINEIMFNPMDDADELGEYVELLNRSAAAVDLSTWRFDNGIAFTFPEGTVLAAGAYLVVARDPDFIHATYGIANVVGPFVGSLANDEERIELVDAAGNTVDEVHYYDSWADFADGGGSSLELRDARADNARAGAWAASDEASKAEWQTYSYRAKAAADRGPTRWNEFVFGLLDAGALLLDDIYVRESPAGTPVEFLQNSTFEGGAAKWRFLGTHRHAEVIVDPDDAGNHVLALAASGETEHMHNHVETTYASGRAVVSSREYEISFRAKWLGGSNLLHTRLYFNRVARTTALALPPRRGTPGAPNSTAEANIGPTGGLVRHEPVVPAASEAVTVTAEAEDPDGVAQAVLWWSVNAGAWQSAAMTAADGVYRGVIPGSAARATVQFYVEALDFRGAGAFFPAGGRDSRALIRVQDNGVPASMKKLHTFRMIMTAADAAFLHQSTNVMGNDRLGATVLYDESKVFYDVGVRLKSSERGRLEASRVGFNVSFARDNLFRGVMKTVSLDRAGGWGLGITSSQDEILIKHLANHAGLIPTSYDDIAYVVSPDPTKAPNHTALLIMAGYNDPFLDGQWENGSTGDQYKYELIYYPTTAQGGTEGLKLPQPDEVIGADIANLGDSKESYRWFFLKENNIENDDWSAIIKLGKAFSAPAAQLEAAARDAMDVDQWMRVFVLYSLCGVFDAYMYGNAHNLSLYVRPSDGKVLALPWDMDFSWYAAPTSGLFGNMNLLRIMQLAPYTRMYYGHFKDLLATSYSRAYMDRWIQHYGSMAGQNYAAVSSYISTRVTQVTNLLPKNTPFAIRTNGGADFSVDTETTTLEGSAPVEAAVLLLNGAAVAPTWVLTSTSPKTPTWWSLPVALAPGVNRLVFTGRNIHGAQVGETAINVTSTAHWTPPIIDALLPFEGPASGGTTVDLFGENLLPGLRVWFGEAESPSVTVISAAQARVVAPPGTAGPIDVRAANPDGSERVAAVRYTYLPVVVEPGFVRGDVNADGEINISDAIGILAYIFRSGQAPCLDALDVNDDGALNIADAVSLLGYSFAMQAPPARPFPECGEDPSADAFGCEAFAPCAGGR